MKRRWSTVSLVVALLVGSAVALMAASACPRGTSCVYLALLTAPTATPTPTPLPTLTPLPTPTPLPSPTPTPVVITGLAILGDSVQDEYRSLPARGGEHAATTYNWVELLVQLRGVNVGPVANYDEPRRGGYEYNWARSGATSSEMISSGQHTGVAEQIKAGNVSHVLIQIGTNDFKANDLAFKIISGELRGAALHRALEAIAANVEVAVETVRQAGNADIMVAGMQDYALLNVSPELFQMNDPGAAQRLIEATAYLNRQIEQLASRQGVVYFDFNAAMKAELDRRREANMLRLGGERIDLSQRGDEPHYGWLDDGNYHPGTVFSALFANVYIEKMNQAFGVAIAPLHDAEILRTAGIQP